MRFGVTPVPIPNTMVKPKAADGTMLETIWESRWLPDSSKIMIQNIYTGFTGNQRQKRIFAFDDR